MSTTATLSPAELRRQIAAYRRELSHYETYATALKRVIEKACKPYLHDAIVQARPKTISSFAEKAVRRVALYPDAVNQMTDLCGARVIVQTLSQVESVRQFIEHNFAVVATEDVGSRLGAREFGYRDRHYTVELKPERAPILGFRTDEVATIGRRRAELQVRTLSQHAWAETLHDRTYKPRIRPSAETNRTVALLAALLEEGDRDFDRLVNELDGLFANYAAYADRNTIVQERKTQMRIWRREEDPDKRLTLALRLALVCAALGQHAEVIRLLRPYEGRALPDRDELELALGTALCHQARTDGVPALTAQGIKLLANVAHRTEESDLAVIFNHRRRRSLRARALSRLGWALEIDDSQVESARRCYGQALECEPANPYYLADQLGFQLRCTTDGTALTTSLRPALRAAVETCAEHAAAGIELPFAFLTAGRLRLLLHEPETALQCYLRGAHHCLEGRGCFGCEVLDTEIRWLDRAAWPNAPQGAFLWARELLRLAKAARQCAAKFRRRDAGLSPARASITAPVLVVAGGAVSLDSSLLGGIREPLESALVLFTGTVISGGTRVGIPGLVGDIAARLRRRQPGSARRVVGYHPAILPADAPLDQRYDQLVAVGDHGFSAEQILAIWNDILAAGHAPREVRLLGVGGGDLSAVEYRVALALGSEVGIVMETGGAAEALLKDPHWRHFPNLLPLPNEPATLRAFLRLEIPGSPPPLRPASHRQAAPATRLTPQQVEQIARGLHLRYQEENRAALPPTLRDFDQLDPTFQQANLAQARHAVEILHASGFGVRQARGRNPRLISFSRPEIERLARLEHGRWNLERLRDGWRPGPRDNEWKRHNCIARWDQLSDGPRGVKRYDRSAIAALPGILARTGLEIVRARAGRNRHRAVSSRVPNPPARARR